MVQTRGNMAVFRFYRPRAARVDLLGDFNQWRPGELAMRREENGYWGASLHLPPGTYGFRYLADGRWYVDYAGFGIENGPFGPNGVVRIPPRTCGA